METTFCFRSYINTYIQQLKCLNLSIFKNVQSTFSSVFSFRERQWMQDGTYGVCTVTHQD